MPQKIANFINGRFVPAISGRTLDDIDPAVGAPYTTLPDSNSEDVHAAVEAARTAFPAWSAMPAADRSKILLRIADLIEHNLEPLALAECIDSGKPIT
ncbi:MAG TPA: aldehyde dehydrogenase family protein, partial [Phycisphaerales bacterium]|nr:aldehyde dehydrogenase family protein [Phycisphaerales bacterium]